MAALGLTLWGKRRQVRLKNPVAVRQSRSAADQSLRSLWAEVVTGGNVNNPCRLPPWSHFCDKRRMKPSWRRRGTPSWVDQSQCPSLSLRGSRGMGRAVDSPPCGSTKRIRTNDQLFMHVLDMYFVNTCYELTTHEWMVLTMRWQNIIKIEL